MFGQHTHGGHGHAHGGHGHSHGSMELVGEASSSAGPVDLRPPRNPSVTLHPYGKEENSALPDVPVNELSLAASRGDREKVKEVLLGRREESDERFYEDFANLPEGQRRQLLHQADTQGARALHWAVLNGKEEVTELLVRAGCDVNDPGEADTKQTALHWGASKGRLHCVRQLLENGANVHQKDSQGCTAFHIAAQYGKPLTLHLLFLYGADPQGRDEKQHTALHWASSNGNVETVLYLIHQGVPVNATDVNHSTALHWATIKGRFNAAQKLLMAGADTSVLDSRKMTARDHADAAKHDGLQAMFKVARTHPPMQRWRSKARNAISFLMPTLLLGLALYLFSWHPWYWMLGWGVAVAASVVFIIQPSLPFNAEASIVPCGYTFMGMFWMTVSYFTHLMPMMGTAYDIDHWVFTGFAMLLWVAFLLIFTGEPGNYTGPRITRNNLDALMAERNPEGRFCATCMHQKPLRAKHCRICDRCVTRFDHHCPWIWGCVGARNHHWFLLWLIGLTICNVLADRAGWLTLLYFSGFPADISWLGFFASCIHEQPFVSLVFMINIIHTFWFFALTVSQAWFAASNVTTNEVMNWRRYSYLGGRSFRGPGHLNPFDVGFIGNLAQFFRVPGHGKDWTALTHSHTQQEI